MLANMTGIRKTVANVGIGPVPAQTVAVTGIAVPEAEDGDTAIVNYDVLPANLMVGAAVVTAGNVNVPICNPTGGQIDPGTPTARIQLIKATGSV